MIITQRLYLLLFIALPLEISGQTIFIPAPQGNAKNYTIETDSSTIRVDYHENLNSIREFNELKKEKKSYYRDFYMDTKTLREEGIFKDSYSTGSWKRYNKNGKSEYEIDHDKGTLRLINKKLFPFYDLRMRIKRKADSLIKSIYGKEFFDKSVVFSFDGSDWSREISSAGTIYEETEKPSTFMMRYNIKFDDKHTYRDMIEFTLDERGNYLSNKYEEIYGFEELPQNGKHPFKLTYNNAFEVAGQNGLSKTDTAKVDAFIHWESLKSNSLYNGHYRFYLRQKQSSVIDNRGGGEYTKTTLYKVWVFNPWTGAFIRQKQMKQVENHEKFSGYNSGLIDVQ